MIGSFGDLVFETSDKRIYTFMDFNRNTASRWASHAILMRKPATEFLGADLDSISFTISLNANLGVKPRVEMEKWLEKARSGTAEVFVVGNKGLGVDKWVVKSVSQMWNVVLNEGEVFSGSVNIELQEYVEVLA